MMKSLSLLLTTLPFSEPLTYYTIGDWGLPSSLQASVITAMEGTATASPPDFVMALGDNFYQHGVASAEDPQFQTTFENRFTDASLRPEWYVILGNHDYLQPSSPASQREYAVSHPGSKWILPDLQYVVYYNLCTNLPTTLEEYGNADEGDGSGSNDDGSNDHCSDGIAAFVYIDTPHLAPYETCTVEGVCVVRDMLLEIYGSEASLNGATEAAYEWIDGTLASIDDNADISHIIVSGHYPIYTLGTHGGYKYGPYPSSVVALKERLLPMLETYGVDMYVSGHDHMLEHLQNASSPLQHIVSGSGAKLRDVKYSAPDGVIKHYAESVAGFTKHTIASGGIVTQFVGYSRSDGVYGYDDVLKEDVITVDSDDAVGGGGYEVLWEYKQCSRRSQGCSVVDSPTKGATINTGALTVLTITSITLLVTTVTVGCIKIVERYNKNELCREKKDDERGLREESAGDDKL
jgi:hypothetical protein